MTDLLSITEASKYVGVSRGTIYYWNKKMGLPLYGEPYNRYINSNDLSKLRSLFMGKTTIEKIHLSRTPHPRQWTVLQKDILDGLIISDGYIGHYNNRPLMDYYFVLVSKHQSFFKHIIDILPVGLYGQSASYRRGGNTKSGTYSLKSRGDSYLTSQHKRWYPSGKKVIPPDFKISPPVCLYWYYGDGCLMKQPKRTPHIQLYTDGFSKIDLETIVIPQFYSLGLPCILFKHYHSPNPNNGWAIRFNINNTKRFLNYTGNCTANIFQYKWQLEPRTTT